MITNDKGFTPCTNPYLNIPPSIHHPIKLLTLSNKIALLLNTIPLPTKKTYQNPEKPEELEGREKEKKKIKEKITGKTFVATSYEKSFGSSPPKPINKMSNAFA